MISFQMMIPYQQPILMTMDLLDSLKNAWIQYISFFVLIFIIIYKVILGYAFRNNILENTVSSDFLKC